MRQRKIKDLDEKLRALSGYIVDNPEALKGMWRQEERPVYLELGCGKGKFICEHAEKNPDCDYVAIEGQESVAWFALRNVDRAGLGNVRFVVKYIKDIMDIFEENEIDGMFLNFSDPWPKARHEKRRLTYGERLKTYAKIIKPGGVLEFKTDNDDLFEYSIGQIESLNDIMRVEVLTRDLHKDFDTEDIVTTEYEEKFSAAGKNINYVKVRII